MGGPAGGGGSERDNRSLAVGRRVGLLLKDLKVHAPIVVHEADVLAVVARFG